MFTFLFKKTILAFALTASVQIGCTPAPATAPNRSSGLDTHMPIVDTHMHIYQVDRPGGVPWPPKDNPELYHSSLPADYENMARSLGVVAAGVVEASSLDSDNQWVLDHIAGNAFFPFYVGELQIGSPDFVTNLDNLSKDPRVVGIRSFLWGAPLDLSAKQIADIKELAKRGMTLDILTRNTLNPRTKIDQLAKAVPDQRIILDHLAGAKGATPDPQWVADMQMLAKNPNIYVKFSSFFDMFNPDPGWDQSKSWTSPTDLAQYKPHFDVLFDAFGPDRLIWGSNYPVVKIGGSMRDQIALAEQYLAARGQAVRDKVMAQNARSFYQRIPPKH